MNIDFWWLNFVHSIESINQKRFIFLFHSSLPIPCPSQFSCLPLYFLSMLAALSAFLCSHAHTVALSLTPSIFVIGPSLIVVVTFDVDMLRQSHQLALTSIYTKWLNFERWCVRLFYLSFFSLFDECPNKNHNHFGNIECISCSVSRFSPSWLCGCVAVCNTRCVYVFSLKFQLKGKIIGLTFYILILERSGKKVFSININTTNKERTAALSLRSTLKT